MIKNHTLIKILFLFTLLSPYHAGFAESGLRKLKNKSFKPGEKLSYSVNYGFIRGGVFDLEILPQTVTINDRQCYHIKGTGKSVGTVDWFFTIRDYYQTFLDTDAIVPQKFLRDVTEGSYKKVENVIFDHHRDIAVNNGRDTVKMLNNIQDILSAYYYSRCLDVSNLKVGDVIPIWAYLDAEVTPFHLKYVGKENIKTRYGTFRCMVFKPQLQLGRVFSEDEGMTIWVSDDDNHLPMQIEAKLLVGSLRVSLTDFKGIANPLSSRVQ